MDAMVQWWMQPKCGPKRREMACSPRLDLDHSKIIALYLENRAKRGLTSRITKEQTYSRDEDRLGGSLLGKGVLPAGCSHLDVICL
jgi:hypothetical protein